MDTNSSKIKIIELFDGKIGLGCQQGINDDGSYSYYVKGLNFEQNVMERDIKTIIPINLALSNPAMPECPVDLGERQLTAIMDMLERFEDRAEAEDCWESESDTPAEQVEWLIDRVLALERERTLHYTERNEKDKEIAKMKERLAQFSRSLDHRNQQLHQSQEQLVTKEGTIHDLKAELKEAHNKLDAANDVAIVSGSFIKGFSEINSLLTEFESKGRASWPENTPLVTKVQDVLAWYADAVTKNTKQADDLNGYKGKYLYIDKVVDEFNEEYKLKTGDNSLLMKVSGIMGWCRALVRANEAKTTTMDQLFDTNKAIKTLVEDYTNETNVKDWHDPLEQKVKRIISWLRTACMDNKAVHVRVKQQEAIIKDLHGIKGEYTAIEEMVSKYVEDKGMLNENGTPLPAKVQHIIRWLTNERQFANRLTEEGRDSGVALSEMTKTIATFSSKHQIAWKEGTTPIGQLEGLLAELDMAYKVIAKHGALCINNYSQLLDVANKQLKEAQEEIKKLKHSIECADAAVGDMSSARDKIERLSQEVIFLQRELLDTNRRITALTKEKYKLNAFLTDYAYANDYKGFDTTPTSTIIQKLEFLLNH